MEQNVPTPEDRRAATAMAGSLSNYLMTAVLAIIGGQAVIISVYTDKREHLSVFVVSSLAAIVALLVSFIFGGLGIKELYRLGSEGSWIIRTDGHYFGKQAFFAVVGTVFVILSMFCGDPKQDSRGREQTEIQQSFREIRQSLADQRTELDVLKVKTATPTQPCITQPKKKSTNDRMRGH